MPVKKLTLLALFTTVSLALAAIENAFPPLVPLPGIKLGLANIATLVLLLHFSPKETLAVRLSRVLLTTFFFGQAMSLLYSLAGGLLSLVVMAAAIKLFHRKYLFLTGALGGLFHNMGQLAAAFLVTSTPGILGYFPFLALGGILTGLFTGLCAGFAEKYLAPFLPGPNSSGQ